MEWLPVTRDELRIGLFIKLDHTWLEHPFVRSSFRIVSASEIAIIRQYGLTRIFYDPERSSIEAITKVSTPPPDLDTPTDIQLAQTIAADEETLRKEKAVHIHQMLDHHKALRDAAVTYSTTTKHCAAIMAMVTAGRSEGVEQANHMASTMVDLLSQQTVVLSLVHTEAAADPEEQLAAQTMNVVALSMLTGKFMSLSPQQLHHLSLGSLYHKLGHTRVSTSIQAKGAGDSVSVREQGHLYPQFGKDMLEAVSGVPQEVIDIVSQHREYLDGTGYPSRLTNGAISQLARLVGAVTEYTELTKGGAGANQLNPSQALSHLYVRMKERLGNDVIEPLIATMTVYPPGTFVEMNDHTIGKVVKINADDRLRPVVMLCDPQSTHDEPAIIDLSRERELSIQKSLTPQSIPQAVLEMLTPGRVEGYVLSPLLA